MKESYRKIITEIKSRTTRTPTERNMSKLKMIGLISSMLLLSLAIFSAPSGESMVLAQQQQSMSTMMMSSSSSPLPEPNTSGTLLKATASKTLFEPAAGLSNVFGPKGLFPFTNVFTCANALTCGVSAGSDSKFAGTFEQGNKNHLTAYEATYTSPVTYGPEQIKGHTYKITLTDTNWNGTGAAMPTRQAEFTKLVNNVGFNQIQHGASHVDRSDVPQLFDNAFLYGHTQVTDITNGNNTVVAKDVFTHVMVAHVMDPHAYYRSMKDLAMSPTMVFLFAINIPSGTPLPGVGTLSPDKAQSFTPLSTDVSLKSPPQFSYSVKLPAPTTGSIAAPQSQSTTWPVDDPKQPLFFTFLVFQNAGITYGSTGNMTKSG